MNQQYLREKNRITAINGWVLLLTTFSRVVTMQLSTLLIFWGFFVSLEAALPQQKFVVEVFNFFRRLSISYHLPPMEKSELYNYAKMAETYEEGRSLPKSFIFQSTMANSSQSSLKFTFLLILFEIRSHKWSGIEISLPRHNLF